MEPKKISIAMAALKQGDSYLLQLRGYDPHIGAAGLIGFFGGKLEAGETPLMAVCREIGEETSLVLDPAQGTELGVVEVSSDMYNQMIEVHATVFQFSVDEAIQVVAKEGELVSMTRQALTGQTDRLTPATKAWLEL